MHNLAGCKPDEGTQDARRELEFAGVDVVDLPGGVTTRGEVEIRLIGKIDGWGFTRAWRYWIVKGPGLPLEYAVPLDHKWGHDVRADGDCACRGAIFWGKGHPVNLYHVDTREGLKELADAIRQCGKDGMEKFGKKEAVKEEAPRTPTEIELMSQVKLDELLEYSTSLPTGTTIGKRWKCKGKDGWFLGEYVPGGEPGHVNIKWKRIRIAE